MQLGYLSRLSNVWGDRSGAYAVRHGSESAAVQTSLGLMSEMAANAQDIASRLTDVVESATFEVSVEELSRQLKELLDVYQKTTPPCNFTKLQRALSDTLKLLRNLQEDSVSTAAEFCDLKQRVEALMRKVEEGEADRHAVLLGQLAYTANIIATSYVFGPESRPMSLGDLQSTVAGEGNSDVQQRWQQVVTFAEKQGVTINELVKLSKPLRTQHFGVAHDFPEELDTTTAEQLHEWATRSFARPVEKLLLFLEPLTQTGKPLCPREDVAARFTAL
ncbi:hypothetical protein PLESTB_000789200 [Pleodorina starrii]|uniref:Uncharacterized protein n=1 Tax=Pleodorina starrii TaxID=330485 RepID=A0A9W6F310_9CHLO|nr:hypothetical protein PLESTM_000495700 [Pleodorina starrii]GLC53806.1 hypothetical protein PLESTB_000789200 [Pleodorina starrii]GLC72986.1 hypothetical protein PLESTF_001316800 [Pleodorina starrii]